MVLSLSPHLNHKGADCGYRPFWLGHGDAYGEGVKSPDCLYNRGLLPVGRSGLLSAASTLHSRPQHGFPLQGENQSPEASWNSWQEA